MIIGLFLAIPFVLTNDAMPDEGLSLREFNFTTNETIGSSPIWIGSIEPYKGMILKMFFDLKIKFRKN